MDPGFFVRNAGYCLSGAGRGLSPRGSCAISG